MLLFASVGIAEVVLPKGCESCSGSVILFLTKDDQIIWEPSQDQKRNIASPKVRKMGPKEIKWYGGILFVSYGSEQEYSLFKVSKGFKVNLPLNCMINDSIL